MSVMEPKHCERRLGEQLDVVPDAPGLDILAIERMSVGVADRRTPGDLPESGHARPKEAVARLVVGGTHDQLVGKDRESFDTLQNLIADAKRD